MDPRLIGGLGGAALALLVPAAAGTTTTGGAEEAFVAVTRSSELVAVMLDRNRIAARIPVPREPQDVAVSSDRRLVLVTSPAAGVATLVDAYRGRAVAVFRGLRWPTRVVFSTDGHRAYVSERRSGTLAQLDLPRRRVVRRIAVGSEPGALALSPNGCYLWVTNRRGVAIVDTRGSRVVGHGGARTARDLAFDRSGLFVWVTYRDSGIVGEIRAYPRTGRLRLQQLVGTRLERLELDAAGRVWLTDRDRGTALRLSRRSGKAIERLGGCAGAGDIGIGPSRGRLVIACRETGDVLVWDPVDRHATRVRVGGSPDGVAVGFVP